MPTDHSADPWSGTTYNGFSGGSGATPPPPSARPAGPPARARRPTRALLIGGVAAAAALGVALGLASRPTLDTGERIAPRQAAVTATKAPTAADAAAAAPPQQVQIAVNPPPPMVVPHTGRLDVLPADIARAARRPTPLSPPAAPIISPPAAAQPAPSPQAPSIVDVRPAPDPAPRLRASFDCGSARPGAEQMVCSDPELAAADRELARVYRRALNAGAMPPEELRAEQRDWLDIREDAARRSPRALASVYDQRIGELNEIAAGPYD